MAGAYRYSVTGWKIDIGLYSAANTRLLSFYRTRSRIVTDRLTEHNTMRRHLYLMKLFNRPLRRRRGGEGKTSAQVLCECEGLATLRHTYLGSFFLEPEDVRSLVLQAIWNFSKGAGTPMTWTPDYGEQRACPKGLVASGPRGLKPIYCSILFYSLQQCPS